MPDSFHLLASLFEEGRTIIGYDEKDAMLFLEETFSKASTSDFGFPDADDVWDGIYPFDCTQQPESLVEDCKSALTVATKAIFHAALATADVPTHRDFLRELLRIALKGCDHCLATVELRPLLKQLMCYGTTPMFTGGPSRDNLTGQELKRSVAFLGDCMKDKRIMMHLNHKVDLVDGLFDCVVWGVEGFDCEPWMLYHASLFIQASAEAIFAKSIQRSAAKLLCPSNYETLQSSFVGPPGFSLERWAFWKQRLGDIREKWDMNPLQPGLQSTWHYAKEARRAMEDAEDRALLGLLGASGPLR